MVVTLRVYRLSSIGIAIRFGLGVLKTDTRIATFWGSGIVPTGLSTVCRQIRIAGGIRIAGAGGIRIAVRIRIAGAGGGIVLPIVRARIRISGNFRISDL